MKRQYGDSPHAWREEKNQQEGTGYPAGKRENQAWYLL